METEINKNDDKKYEDKIILISNITTLASAFFVITYIAILFATVWFLIMCGE